MSPPLWFCFCQVTTALLRIRLHCDSCADRIRRRIYKIKGAISY
jgi:copper chaperone CopZ